MPTAVQALADEVHDALMALAPLDASLWGDHRFAAHVPDVSPEGLATADATLARLRDRVVGIDDAALTADDRVTRDVALHALDQARHELDARYVRTAVGPMVSGSGIGSAASALLARLPKLTLRDAAHARAHLQRCRAVPGWLAAAEDQLRAGLHAGCVPPARLVVATIRQIDRYLAVAPDDDPLALPPPAEHPTPDRWRAERDEVLTTVVHAALRRHRTVLADEIAPAARPDDRVGLLHLPDGAALYVDAVALHTTTDRTPEDLHRLGLDLIAALAEEYRDLGGRVLGTTDVDDIFTRLRDDPTLRFATGDEIYATAETSLRRAEASLEGWFPVGPVGPCDVREIPPVEAPESTIGYYQPPAADGSRAGAYYVNTSEPHERTRYEAEVLAFHESVPGHHTQIATALALDLPQLQRMCYLTAYAEGWGLYIERLADRMGLYSDDVSRLGMLSFDSWRAGRLVVDTGMHAFGWPRDRAVAFLRDNSPLPPRTIDNEVDRYICWPGQALAYMTGRIHIAGLADHARRTLGAAFDIAAFHGAVLSHGAVPLHTLDRIVDEWLADGAV